MKAITCLKYGPPSLLKYEEVPKPADPKGRELLIKIHAATVNDYDWAMVRGKPYIYRLLFGLTKPKRPIPGMELAGVVEAVGPEVTSYKSGDAVYGDISSYGFGTFAEYICIDERAVVHKPDEMSFEDAAATPHASLLAYQGLVEVGKIQKGQKVLINGAGGGMGTFGLQIAKRYNAEVTGVDAAHKLKMLTSLGFDHVIDYRKEDFTKSGRKYDLILDAKTTRSPAAYERALKPDGKYVTVGGLIPKLLQLLISRMLGKKRLFMVGLKANRELDQINEWYVAGSVKPVLDGPYPLKDVPKLVQFFGEGKHLGKIVITIS